MAKRSLRPDLLRITEPQSLPSWDELIAESRVRGWDDLAAIMEQAKYLESPEGQKALERREKRLSRL